jgi:tRNA threonylcarbamoyladenosine biosynthesis protein TsaE
MPTRTEPEPNDPHGLSPSEASIQAEAAPDDPDGLPRSAAHAGAARPPLERTDRPDARPTRPGWTSDAEQHCPLRSIQVETATSGETEALAAQLAQRLRPGDIVLVSGELGAGKTTFVRGACRALGVRSPVTSPTFTIARRYEGDVPVSHLDLYRLGDLADEDPALLADELAQDRVAFVEWPQVGVPAGLEAERVAARVSLEHRGGDRRLVRVEP